MNPRVLLKGLGLILSLALVGWLFDQSDLGNAINESWIDSHIRGHGIEGTLLFLAMGTIFTAVGLPRQIIAFLAGYAFDIVLGTFYGALATLLGCAVTFIYARLFGRGLLSARFGARARHVGRAQHRAGCRRRGPTAGFGKTAVRIMAVCVPPGPKVGAWHRQQHAGHPA